MKKLTLFICFFLLLHGALVGENLDVEVYNYIQDEYRSPALTFAMQGVTTFGNKKLTSSICIGMMGFTDTKSREIGKLTSFSLISSQSLTLFLKMLVNRQRPHGRNHPQYRSSFPSGHTSAIFSIAHIMGNKYKQLKLPFYTLACGVGFSRVYLKKHYPSDVIAGASIGILTGVLTLHFEKKIKEWLDLKIPLQ